MNQPILRYSTSENVLSTTDAGKPNVGEKMSRDEFHTDDDTIKFISYNPPIFFPTPQDCMKAKNTKTCNRNSTSPSATNLQIGTSKTYNIKRTPDKAY